MSPGARDGLVPSPNIWYWPDVYERENHAQDADAALWAALVARADWVGADVLDVGCGDGFHLPAFAEAARSVTGIEPHGPCAQRARRRVRHLPAVRVLQGSAQRLPVADQSMDLVHARTAYFFGPGCEPGLAEADRVLRPGGTLAIIDLDGTAAPYGDWLRAATPGYHPTRVEEFFTAQGFDGRRVDTVWRFDRRADLEAALRVEFPPRVAARAIARIPGLTIPVRYRMHLRDKPAGLLRVPPWEV